ncbi:hypothetical protein N865_21445 [Intrasporangium oryzae NRRL B-24470]|uniref:Aromatic ring-opening dioxygenase LigA n=1 Tax=Intrasporangium oryzae NRRL B-24470 TaxID=1386089 RepID=W9G7B3_9MICO|nr:hypothetical protein [Intrasporangium oryzae]EWT00713.1 hypothetical protein N865_21445 [Intrasporangium oryzae NRRL B-24470]
MRKSFDKLISWTGLIMAGVLLVAGGLLMWAATFVNNNVTEQLQAQKITMPAAAALTTQDMKDNLAQYSGQQMTTGDQAKAYADHFILAHMNEASGGKSYSEVSGAYLKLAADPNADQAQVAKLGELRQTLFMGSTLRGLLLYGYAFATMGKIAGIGAIVAFVGAVILTILAVAGLNHARHLDEGTTTPEATATPTPEPVTT